MGVKIGNEILTHGLFLAPMAGYSDRAMRVVCREADAEYAVIAGAVAWRRLKSFNNQGEISRLTDAA